jgi:hypothetical protein
LQNLKRKTEPPITLTHTECAQSQLRSPTRHMEQGLSTVEMTQANCARYFLRSQSESVHPCKELLLLPEIDLLLAGHAIRRLGVLCGTGIASANSRVLWFLVQAYSVSQALSLPASSL